MEMSAVVNQMIVMFLLLLVGLLCAKIGVIDAAFNRKLSYLVLNVAQVATILAAAMNVDDVLSAGKILGVLGIGFLVLLLLYLFSFGYTFLFRIPRPERGVWQFLATLGNFGFMGFPVTSALLGAQALFYNSLALIPMLIVSYTLGVAMLTGGRGQKLRLKAVLLCPPLLASVLAAVIVLTGFRPPAAIVTAANTLGGMTTPGAMLVVGASLGQMSAKEVLGDWRMYAFSLLRLLSAPVLIWLILRQFVHDGLVLSVMVLLSAMPSAANATMMSMQYGGDEKAASRGVFLSTLFSFVTIPLLVWLLL